jgi:nitrite reductase (NO-forming)
MMTDQADPATPRTLPGQEGSPVSRAGTAIVGLILVVGLSLAVLLVRPGPVAGAGETPGGPADIAASAVAVDATGRTTAVTVRVDGMSFVPSAIEVPVGDILRVTLVNTGDQRHDLAFANGASTGMVAPGAQATVDVGVIRGHTEGWCTVPGHRQMGMVLDVAVVGGPATTDSSGASGSGDMSAGHSMSGTSGHAMAGSPPVDDASAPTMAELMAFADQVPAYPAEVPPLGPATDHQYEFRVTEQVEDVTSGLTRAVWTYNGTSPGPVLHGRVGDTFRITLVNDGTMGHSVDFHAGDVSPDMPMRTIEPGQSLQYDFTARRSGIWMYHCSTMPMSSHIANGLLGAVIIEPNDLEPVDRSYVLIQSEEYLGADGQPADADKVAAMLPDVVAFNGRAFQYDAHPLAATVGERMRLWVLDAGPNVPLSFHVVGMQFDTVWSEGGYRVHHGRSTDGLTTGATGAQVLSLLPAEGGFVEFLAREPGRYAFVNHQMSLAERGAHGVLDVTG